VKENIMPLVHHTYGKGRVRVLRLHRAEHGRHEVRELTLRVLLEGDFGRAFTEADNATSVATDSVKNLVNVVARENLSAEAEPFCRAVGARFLDRYPQIARVVVSAHETRWRRLVLDGQPHPYGFTLDANGKPTVRVTADRDGTHTSSGVEGFTFMKTTESGWVGYVMDEYTTLPETSDRIAATSMDASWDWQRDPTSFPEANDRVLDVMLRVFSATYSASVQDSLYRMGEAVLDAVPEVARVRMACPNKHYIPVNLAPFGLDNRNQVFLPTDEPHGQIECTVGRGEA